MGQVEEIEIEIKNLRKKANLLRIENKRMHSILESGLTFLDLDMTIGKEFAIDINGIVAQYVTTYNNHIMKSLYMKIPKDFVMPQHKHISEEELIILDGTVQMTVNNELVTASKGDIIKVDSLVLHDFKAVTDCILVSNLYAVGAF